MGIRIVLACCTLLAAGYPWPAWCAEGEPSVDPWQDPIAADRPGAATPPSVVGRGAFQIETSFEAATAHPPGAPSATTVDFPTLLRLGVGHALELRFESNTLSHQASGVPGSPTGFADVSIEAKWSVIGQSAGLIPAVALLPAVSLPTGSADFSAGHAQPGIGALFGWALRSGTALTLATGASHVADDEGDRQVWQMGWEAAIGVPLTRHWAVSSDLFVTDPLVEGLSTAWGADAGLAFYPNPDTQLDVAVSHTFGERAGATSVQIGFSRRWSLGRTRGG